jgi:uncharacterized LabA/DUF88 family protein
LADIVEIPPVAQQAPPKKRAIVYIDGFNFYHGAIEGTPYKWLDLQAMAQRLRNDEEVVAVKYFTALSPRTESQIRQSIFLQALTTLPLVKTVLGRFKDTTIKCRHKTCTLKGDREFHSSEEKRTDVAIGVTMVDDAHHNRCDTFVLISGDSDLVPAVSLIKGAYPAKRIVVYVPGKDGEERRADELRSIAHKCSPVPTAILKVCLLPDTVTLRDGQTKVTKPKSW